MYVIRIVATNSTGTETNVADRAISGNGSSTFYLPADRCSWQITSHTGGGYEIANVYFYGGNETGEQLAQPANITINASFGYIGKSGRFVELAQ